MWRTGFGVICSGNGTSGTDFHGEVAHADRSCPEKVWRRTEVRREMWRPVWRRFNVPGHGQIWRRRQGTQPTHTTHLKVKVEDVEEKNRYQR
jgi:hypothetical protein